MSDTYSDYARQCKDTLGGIEKAYLLPYIEYDETLIKSTDIELITFPMSQVYEFEVNGSFTQQSTLDKGNVSFAQNVQIDMSKIYNFYDVNVFVRNDFRVITLDNNGNLVLFGTNNGMTCNLTNASGNEKGEFNGFTLNFEGKEELTGLFVDDFDDFFFIDTPGDVFNYDLNFDIIG
jgi:hypothetical protein